jgi:hypothetical protein
MQTETGEQTELLLRVPIIQPSIDADANGMHETMHIALIVEMM